MNFFTKKNIEKQQLTVEEIQKKKEISAKCSQEIKEICEKYNCSLQIKQEIVIIPR